MKQTTEKVYRCDHCNKAMVSAGFMAAHERMCKKNPNNQHKCFEWCKHLKRDVFNDEVSFMCGAQNNLEMHSYKLERYKYKHPRLKDLQRMPLECNLYEDKHPEQEFTPSKNENGGW